MTDNSTELKRCSKVKKNCEKCGKEYLVHYYRRNISKYCCKKCYDEAHKKTVIIKCLLCGKEFSITKSHIKKNRGKFCSRDCYAKYRSLNYSGKNHPMYKGLKAKCAFCGKVFPIQQNAVRHKEGNFCSKRCLGEWRSKNKRGINHPQWRGGISFEPYCILFNNEFKNRVRAFFGNKCAVCGKTKLDNNNRELSIHHVIYNKQSCCDDSERLFVPLCISCHTKTNHNRDHWQEYFTKLINEKYNGRCYYTKEEFNAINS